MVQNNAHICHIFIKGQVTVSSLLLKLSKDGQGDHMKAASPRASRLAAVSRAVNTRQSTCLLF